MLRLSLILTAVAPIAILAFVIYLSQHPDNQFLIFKVATTGLLWSAILVLLSFILVRERILRPMRALFAEFDSEAPAVRDLMWSPHFFSAVNRVIRERKESQQREKLIVDVAGEIVCCLDVSLSVLSINSAGERILGVPSAKIIGKHFSTLALPESIVVFEKNLKDAQSTGTPQTFEVRLITAMGAAVDVLFVMEWSESLQCFFGCGEDISSQKKLERAKREFLETVSHDVKVPLTTALANVQVLELGVYGELPETAVQVLASIESNVKTVVDLVREIQEIDRVSTTKDLPVQTESIKIANLIAAAVTDVEASAAQRHITIVTHPVDTIIQGDRARLHRVLLNLLSNAVKYAPERSTIDVSAQASPNEVHVSVRDQGPGIPAEYRRLIFERYERMERHSELEGTGLGLAIAKAIIEAHQGEIGVDSSSNGSTFWFRIPIKLSAE